MGKKRGKKRFLNLPHRHMRITGTFPWPRRLIRNIIVWRIPSFCAIHLTGLQDAQELGTKRKSFMITWAKEQRQVDLPRYWLRVRLYSFVDWNLSSSLSSRMTLILFLFLFNFYWICFVVILCLRSSQRILRLRLWAENLLIRMRHNQ